jgi:hypothetical protein
VTPCPKAKELHGCWFCPCHGLGADVRSSNQRSDQRPAPSRAAAYMRAYRRGERRRVSPSRVSLLAPQIRFLAECGISISEISRRTGVDRGSIYNLLDQTS